MVKTKLQKVNKGRKNAWTRKGKRGKAKIA